MKRILALVLVMGLFYITMSGLSSAQPKSAVQPEKQAKSKSNYNRDDLKTGLARAFYDALVSAENDLDDENNRDGEEIEGQDGKKYSAFEEARRTIFQADPILARIKAQNKKALVKLRNPPRRILPGQKQPQKKQPQKKQPQKKQAAKGQQDLKQQIEAQEKLIKQQQQKLNHLKKELVLVPAKS